MITIAAAKGYLLGEAIKLFKTCNIIFEDDVATTRKLSIKDTTGTVELLIIRPWDVPVYVAEGAADLGIVGKDILVEQHPNVLTLSDLKFGRCSLVLAGPTTFQHSDMTHNIRVATKFPNTTRRYFDQLGIKATILKLYGAIELAPLTGLSDIICDLTATGTTLKENNLHIIETVLDSTAHLIGNKVSLKVNDTTIRDFVTLLNKYS